MRNRYNKILKLNLTKYINDILKRFNKQYLNPVFIPGIRPEKNKCQALASEIELY
jgi:hypothetical protein